MLSTTTLMTKHTQGTFFNSRVVYLHRYINIYIVSQHFRKNNLKQTWIIILYAKKRAHTLDG